MNGIEIKPSDSAVHIGVTRSGIKEVELSIDERIMCARRTKYGILGTGFHGTNRIDPITAYQIYKTYVLPRLLYGLEILPLTRTQINLLEGFHRNSIRYMQSLPQRTAVSAVYLLIGAYPVETEIHLRQLSLLYSLLFCHNGKIKEVVSRQISVNYDNTKSFFCNIRKILEIYELPKMHELQSNLPPKPKWKNLVNSTIKKYWTEKLKEETSGKTTLKFMSCDHLAIWL